MRLHVGIYARAQSVALPGPIPSCNRQAIASLVESLGTTAQAGAGERWDSDVAHVGGNHQVRSQPRGLWRSVLSCFCASLVGIGLARFAYTPLLPAIIDAHWFEQSAAAYLGAANLAGYLAGALAAKALEAHFRVDVTLRAMMLVATASFFACAQPSSFLWFFVWRCLAGISGGVLMVLAAPHVLRRIPPARRGLLGGLIFMGIGIGVVLSGTVVPLLLTHGVSHAWIALGIVSAVATVVAWHGWPSPSAEEVIGPTHGTGSTSRALRALYAEYALNAAAWIPHMLFLVDFVSRGLNRGLDVGAHYWVVFGLGATLGPVAAGHLADRAGFAAALRLAFLLQTIAIALPAISRNPLSLIFSSCVVGAFVTGTVPLILGRIHELRPHRLLDQSAAWSRATGAFAVFQAAAAYGASWLFAQTNGNYRLLFFAGALAMLTALAIELATEVTSTEPGRPRAGA